MKELFDNLSYNITNLTFENEDANDDKNIISTIYERDIYIKIKKRLNNINAKMISNNLKE